jgi:energy-coupling factor transport system substrate-specific component
MQLKKGSLLIAALIAVVVLMVVLLGSDDAGSARGSFVAVGLAAVVALLFAGLFEGSGIQVREIAIVALLGTLSALLRVPFAAIPSLQPSTYLVICSGFVLGPVAGFMVGALTAVVSNFFLGQGPWTLFQMVAWGLAGASAPLLRSLPLRSWVLAGFGFVWGFVFGAIMNTWTWVAFVYPNTIQTFIVTWANSIWFDAVHAVGNALFLSMLGVRTIAILRRYYVRFHWVRVESSDSDATCD